MVPKCKYIEGNQLKSIRQNKCINYVLTTQMYLKPIFKDVSLIISCIPPFKAEKWGESHRLFVNYFIDIIAH